MQSARGSLLVCRDVGRGSIDDEEEPEELVAALHDHMAPHAAADEWLTAPMWLLQQQLRRWVLGCQGCTPHNTDNTKGSQTPRLYTRLFYLWCVVYIGKTMSSQLLRLYTTPWVKQ